MIELLVITLAGTTGNIILRTKKKKKALEEAKDMFNEHGYYVSDKNIKKLLRYQLGKDDHETLNNAFSDYRELILQFFPGINFYYILQNIKFLKETKSSQDFYHNYGKWDLYVRQLSDNIKPIDILEEDLNIKQINIPKQASNITFGNHNSTYPKAVNRDVSKLVLKPNQNK